jgi:hypothetical protein
VTVEPDPDQQLHDVGMALAAQVAAAVEDWVVRCVEVRAPPETPERQVVLERAWAAGAQARAEVGAALEALLSADVDAQSSTPMEVVRAAVRFPAAVLHDAGVAEIARDRFAVERLPDDVYGLTPGSLAAIDPSLSDIGVAWGAAKAMAHRKRHGGGHAGQ